MARGRGVRFFCHHDAMQNLDAIAPESFVSPLITVSIIVTELISQMNKPDLDLMGQAARLAARHLARATSDQKNAALYGIADALDAHSQDFLTANVQDYEDSRTNGLNAAMLDRLSLKGRLAGIAEDARQVSRLPDPVGETFDSAVLPNGLK